jgi:hypothetical protein
MSPEPAQQIPSPSPVEAEAGAEALSDKHDKVEHKELVGKEQEEAKSAGEDPQKRTEDGGEQVTNAASPPAQGERRHEGERQQPARLEARENEAKDEPKIDEQQSGKASPQLRLAEPSSGKTVVPSPPMSPLPPAEGSSAQQDTGSPEPPPPPPKDDKYLSKGKATGLGIDTEFEQEKDAVRSGDRKQQEEGAKTPAEEVVDDSQSEIASIMEQFDDGKDGPDEQEIMSPRLEIAQPMFGSQNQHPPRRSSLEPIRSGTPDSLRKSSQSLMSPPPRSSSLAPSSPVLSLKQQGSTPNEPESPLTPQMSKSLPPPPQPDPEPILPFDFQRFLEQLRHKSADPVAKYLRSFLLEFGKKPWMVHEQVKIISDFLEFITKKMAQCEVWRTVSDAEFDNAREGMEKLVMNRLYTQTFSPAIPPPEPAPPSRSKRRAGDVSRPGRRGQHQEDVERDEVLAQKVRIYGWVREEHLDIQPIGEKGKKFMDLAQKGMRTFQSFLYYD